MSSLLVAAGLSVGWSQEAPAEGQAEAQAPAAGSELTEQERQVLEQQTRTTYRSWEEMVTDWMTPRPVPKSIIIRLDEKYAYPHAAVTFKMEIVREDEDTVWLRGLPPEDPESALHDMWLRRERQEMIYQAQRDWESRFGVIDYYVDFASEIVPPPFMDALTFEPVRTGLPNRGLWQMNFVVDDMNEDGVPDLVFPPARKGITRPSIFLGKGDGVFDGWKDVTWPGNVPFDYGGIATGDFNADGHRDLALAIHFKGQYVLYGNGKGDFARAELLPSPDPRVTSRAPAVGDFNADGRDDVAFLAEIDYDMGASTRIEDAITLWVALSTGKNWRLWQQGMPQRVIGDSLEAADLDGDGRVDLVMGSNATDWRRLVTFNRGDDGWDGPLPRGVLSNAQHPDVAVHRDEDGTSSVFATFIQFRMVSGQNIARTGVIRYQIEPEGIMEHGEPVFFDDQRFDSLFRVGVGDLDGNGLVDVVAGRRDGEVAVYLQSATGEYYREQAEELVSRGRAYDIQLADLNGDGRDDLIVAFASEEGEGGGVEVWLSRSNI
jgi:hypothetical protein